MVARGFLALLLLTGGLFAFQGEPSGPDASGLPDWLKAFTGTREEIKSLPLSASSSAPLSRSVGATPAKFEFPGAQSWRVTLGQPAPAGKPVRVAAKNEAAKGKPVEVNVFDRATAQRTGASGFVFQLSNVDKAEVELTVDYSSFANAYGGDYAARLGLVALPACVLDGCGQPGKRLPARNNLAAQSLTADAVEGEVFAVTAGIGGDTGTYAASPMSVNGTWQVSPGSGAFSYTYPIDVPKAPGGTAPSVSMSYSSSMIDGLTLASNTQATPIGVGWSDFAGAYIERRYEPCFRHVGTADLCWKSDNATLSLNGISGVLLPTDGPANTQWRLLSDPGWRIQRDNQSAYAIHWGAQRWIVTGPDGTKYYFGFGHMPGRFTNSVLSVPVLADESNEPCRAAGDTIGACHQAWRWYLDRVEDRDGNVQSYLYEREENIYSAIGGLGNNEVYHRGALLKEIIYGGRGWHDDHYAARVTFGHEHRCWYLVANCPPATPHHTGFPDAPTDLICDNLAKGTCSVHAPAFFTTRRYSYVRTDVKAGNTWKPIAQHNIYHEWGDGADGAARKLRVRELQHAAIAFGKLNAYPTTKFGYFALDNRFDHLNDINRAMRHARLVSVTNPLGGVTSVTYAMLRPCDPYRPPRWDENQTDCFPQHIKDGDFTRQGVFKKYVVTRVAEHDGYNADTMVTGYTYEGTPAWAFDDSAFSRDEDEVGWSQWRGYQQVSIRKGTSWTRLSLFRGWHLDKILKDPGTGDLVPVPERQAKVTASDGTVFNDDLALIGRTLEEQQLGTIDGVAGSILQTRIHRYETRLTPISGYLYPISWVGVASTTERTATARNVFRDRRSRTTHNSRFQPTTTLEEGWLDVTGDERCSITTYADNAAEWMFVYPAVNKKVAGACNSTTVLSQSQTFYDGSTTLGAAPMRGNPTQLRTQVDGSTWSVTRTEYDEIGRPVKVIDPRGFVYTTAHSVAAGGVPVENPAITVTTNPLGHQETTEWVPEFGVRGKVTDANGKVTVFGYDEFGRADTVWLPTEPLAYAEPSFRFIYDIPNRSVRTRRLTSEARCCEAAVFEETWVIYDGLGRERQVQGRSPDSGRVLVSETTYDNRGMVRDSFVEQAFPGTPGAFLEGGSGWLNRTRHTYDELGRQTRSDWMRGNAIAHATTTTHTADTVTVTGPEGRRVRERVDGLGRTIAVEEFDGSAWAASNYRYDLADRLVSVLDPAGNKIDYAYNLSGWRTGQVDPNRGTALFGYDAAGNQTVVGTPSSTIHQKFDALGRIAERRADSSTGPVLATWQYDTAPGGKGKPHKENSAGWVTEVLGYDDNGRATGTKLTVPAGIAGLSGSYELKYTYDRPGRVRKTSLPAIGGLPAEDVVTDLNSLGLVTRVAGLEEYVSGVSYDDRGRRTAAAFGPKPGGVPWMAKKWTFDVDQQLNGSQTLLGSTVLAEHQLVFDNAGNLKSKLTKQNGLAWRECFGYDPRARLVDAHTVAAATACAGGTAGTGDRAYRHTYSYSPDGKLLSRSENGVATAYTYPAAGALRPHAPTKVGADTYSWDEEGKLTSRTVAGAAETFSWDKQDRLASVTGPSGTTSFVYDASGQRLLRRTPDGRSTLYWAGHEITVSSTGARVTSVRTYTLDGATVATRTLAGVDYLISDPAGSVEMAIRSGAAAPSATRAYLPYGRVRAETGDLATDRGFAGQVEDASTKLSYMNARYYDARAGVFISADPLFNSKEVKSLNPYTYASGNPATFADPSGLYSAYAWGLELENSRLRAQNRELIAHIGALNAQIAEMQDIIQKQADAINQLLTYVEALEAEIMRQASIIEQLQARVAYLERVVAAQAREISRLRGIIAWQAGVISYYKGIVNVLGFRLWGGTPQYAWVMNSIHSFRGIPAGAINYDRVSRLQATVAARNATIAANQKTIAVQAISSKTKEVFWKILLYVIFRVPPTNTPPVPDPPRDPDPTEQLPPGIGGGGGGGSWPTGAPPGPHGPPPGTIPDDCRDDPSSWARPELC